MSLRERLVATQAGGVAVTAVLVAGADRIWGEGVGLWGLEMVAVAVALVVTVTATRALVVAPLEQQLSELAARVRRRGGGDPERPTGEWDPELRVLEEAIDSVMSEIEETARRVEKEGRMAREVVQTSTNGIALISEDGVITDLNDSFRGMFRLRGEPIGRRPLEAVPVIEIHEVIEAARQGQNPERAFTTESRDLIARAQPLSEGVLVRVEDVTGQREAERARSDFVANVSHELRTPVTAVMGYLETLMQDIERIPEDLRPLLVTVERNARRLRDLFEDLLRLHRIEARRRELPRSRQRLRPILEGAVGPAIDRAHMRGQTFELDCPVEVEGTVNPEALSAIVANLATNASAYTPEGGAVVVTVRPTSTGARIDVRDNGIGIAQRHHERIFERFYRVDEARSRRVGGTGLGLAIVKHYALASGCTVTLDSKEGQGTTFSVHVPR